MKKENPESSAKKKEKLAVGISLPLRLFFLSFLAPLTARRKNTTFEFQEEFQEVNNLPVRRRRRRPRGHLGFTVHVTTY